MNPTEQHRHPTKYIELCQNRAIQALNPTKESTDSLWLPTAEELLQLLQKKLPYPDNYSFHQTDDGWVYTTYFREWAEDYGTYIDTQRQFTGNEKETVLLQVLIAILGIDGRWMV